MAASFAEGPSGGCAPPGPVLGAVDHARTPAVAVEAGAAAVVTGAVNPAVVAGAAPPPRHPSQTRPRQRAKAGPGQAGREAAESVEQPSHHPITPGDPWARSCHA